MKVFFTLLLSISFLFSINAQNDLGFRYQAIAMDEDGEILKNQRINLKIKLVTDINSNDTYYEEVHALTSNENGIMNSTIGSGKVLSGSFDNVPWESKSIWIYVALDTDLDNNYDVENYAQLLAVPYALYAMQAEKLTGSENPNLNPQAKLWEHGGSITTPGDSSNRVGTINNHAITIITSNQDRIKIFEDGQIQMLETVRMKKNLNILENFQVNGQAFFKNETNSNTKDDGAVVLEGGLGIEKNLNVGGEISTTGLVIDGNKTGPDSEWDSYPVQITGIEQGIAVKLLDPPDAENNFITFFDENENAVGRIEGQTKIDILQSQDWIVETTFQSAAIASSIGSFASQAASDAKLAFDVAEVVVDVVEKVINVVGAVFASVGASAEVGDLVCQIIIAIIDIAYKVVKAGVNIAANFLDFTLVAFDATVNIANFIQYQTLTFLNSGSTFSSGSADYAEYLPKLLATDKFTPGDVVGIINGMVTKNIEEANHLMVVSSDPLVLGNMPLEGDEHLFEKVAFMGQVPVKVKGPVESGDYLIADKENIGFAKAVSPKDLTLEDCKKLVGVSWGSSQLTGINYVNTAIGLNENDVIPILENQVKEMHEMKVEINEIKKYILENETLLAELVPGYLEAKEGRSLEIDADLIASVNADLTQAANASIMNNLEGQDLYGMIDNYAAVRRGDSQLPLDKTQIMSMVNKIDSEHDLNLAMFNSSNAVGILDDIESVAESILYTDYVAEFKNAMTGAVADAVQLVADEILAVKSQMISDIATAALLTDNEEMMLEEKLNEFFPIFGLLENSGQLVTDITNDIFAIIDEAACVVCNQIDSSPIQPDDIIDAISIPLNFFIETIDFFVGTLTTLNNTCVGDEICVEIGGVGDCVSFNVCPFSFIPDINFDINDMPFVDNKQVQIMFPDFCASVNCN